MAMKLKTILNSVLAAAVVLLGFNACKTPKGTARDKTKDVPKDDGMDSVMKRDRREPIPCVYGPPPREFKDTIKVEEQAERHF